MVLGNVLQNVVQPDPQGLGCIKTTSDLLLLQVREWSFHVFKLFAKGYPMDLNFQAFSTL